MKLLNTSPTTAGSQAESWKANSAMKMPDWRIKDFRSAALPAMFVVSAANFLNYFDRTIFNLLLDPVRHEFSLTNSELGLLAGAFALLFAIMSLPLAWLADRSRRLTIMAAAIGLWSLATASGGLARNFTQLFVARMCVGVGEAGCLPASASLIADHHPAARRPRAMAIYQGCGLVGTTCGLILIGFLADRYGWRLALIFASLPGLLLAFAPLFLREPPRGRFDTAVGEQKPWRESVATLLRSPPFLLIVAGIGFVGLGNNAIGVWGATMFVRSYGMSLSEVGLLFGLSFGLCSAAGTFAGGAVTSALVRRDPRWEFRVPAFAFLVAVPVFELALVQSSPMTALALFGLGCFTAFLGYGPVMSLYHLVATSSTRATATTIGAVVASLLGSFGAPVAVGALTDALTPTHGPQALRLALALFVIVFLLPAALYALAGRIVFGRKDGQRQRPAPSATF